MRLGAFDQLTPALISQWIKYKQTARLHALDFAESARSR